MSVDQQKLRILEKMRDLIHGEKLSPEEAINIVGELLAHCIVSAVDTEQDGHQILNSATESGHLFINTVWREAVILKQQRASKG